MLKVTIDLPGGVTLTLEATEPHVYREVIAQILESLPVGLRPNHRSTSSAPVAREEPTSLNGNLAIDPRVRGFCQELAPLGDMRRVVVAAEGARRFLGMDQVSPQELDLLFEAIGWPKPRDFVQTLRNAGRRKFHWLQRVPGNSGYYALTENGRREMFAQAGT